MSQDRNAVDWDWGDERVTIGRSFLRDMEGLWSEVLKLAAVVEDALNQSVHGLCDGRVELARELKHQKKAVDQWEVQIERECVRVLALHQPVASDLRRVAAVLKINGDLEHLGNGKCQGVGCQLLYALGNVPCEVTEALEITVDLEHSGNTSEV